MTLTLTAIDHDELCHGWSWKIVDEDVLAESVARVALGQYRHVARILAGADVAGPATTADHIAGATKFLTVEAGKEPWHRDGWRAEERRVGKECVSAGRFRGVAYH